MPGAARDQGWRGIDPHRPHLRSKPHWWPENTNQGRHDEHESTAIFERYILYNNTSTFWACF